MEKIALPKKIDFIKGDKANQKRVVIEPCYPGYGATLGNAVRRVLLSSLPGAAVVGVKIKGADHEFMALPHVKEDVLEIILNLKQLRLKVHSDEVVKLELDVHGEKEVKASDIKKDSQVEIINSDLVLANVTDMAGNLNMEIYVSKGKGYEMVENRKGESRDIGYIEIDSIFSPVSLVGIKVENVRVGKMTDWDKLILDIKTDGIITPEEAFEQSVKILIEQFNSLIGITEGNEEELQKSQKNDTEETKKIEDKKIKKDKK
ncbi:MAG: DNA-directed RNA polymerase subunit alpha [Candidatus Falkowbacteria bacterium]